MIHKFKKNVDPKQPYSERDDIIVISDEAHRTQAGRLARNMRLALPTAAFIGFTGTPLFGQDDLTKGSGLASERVCQGSDLSPFQRPK